MLGKASIKSGFLITVMLVVMATSFAQGDTVCDKDLQVGKRSDQILSRLPIHDILIQFAKSKGDLITFMMNLHAKMGASFRIDAPLNLRNYVVTAEPDAIRTILRDTDRNPDSAFIKDPNQLKPLQKFGGKNTMVSAPYEIWKPQRQAVAAAFTPREIGSADYTAKIETIVGGHVATIKKGEIDYQKFIKRTSLDAILKLLFSYEAPAAQLDVLTGEAGGLFGKRLIAETLNPFEMQVHELPNVTEFQRKLKGASEATQQLAEDVMKHIEADPESARGFQALLVTMKTPEDLPLTREEIKNQIRLFVFAGHDTTAHTLTWAFEEILSNAQIKDKLMELVRGGDKAKALEYIDAVWNEALRLHMPITFLQRMAKTDATIELGGQSVRIKKGTTLVLDTMSLQRNEELFGAAKTGFLAAEFHPERFLKDHMAAFNLTAKDLETFAFGSGPRVCIGAYLARAEAREILFQFFQNIDAGSLEGLLKMSPTNQSLVSPVHVTVSLH